ncbi:hypothetical protein GJ496_004606 [Pomphorhynchus laevis]|nr:hypothetical protein GJ496_004606 [Pomphorhynchus laevis]
MIVRIVRAASPFGIILNPSKYKIMFANCIGQIIFLDDSALVRTDIFYFLECAMTLNDDIEEDIKLKIINTSRSFAALTKLWKRRYICVITKVRVYSSIIKPILLCGCETWPDKLTLLHRVITFLPSVPHTQK